MLTDLRLPPARCGGLGLVDSEHFTRFEPHRHVECEINLVERGWAEVLERGSATRLEAGQLLFLPARCAHSLLRTSADVRLWVIVLRPEEAPGFPERCSVVAQYSVEEGRLLGMLTEQLRRSDEDMVVNAGLRYLYAVLHHGGERARIRPGRRTHPALFRVIEHLNQETEPTRLPELARVGGVSGSYLLELIQRETGQSLTTLRQRIHLRRFMRLHEVQRERGLLANALDAGFGSYNQFARVFARELGTTPARYYRGGTVSAAEETVSYRGANGETG